VNQFSGKYWRLDISKTYRPPRPVTWIGIRFTSLTVPVLLRIISFEESLSFLKSRDYFEAIPSTVQLQTQNTI
jgi:hypothetical protein